MGLWAEGRLPTSPNVDNTTPLSFASLLASRDGWPHRRRPSDGCNVSSTVDYVKALNTRYGLPVWLTEFSCATAPADKQLGFAKEM